MRHLPKVGVSEVAGHHHGLPLPLFPTLRTMEAAVLMLCAKAQEMGRGHVPVTQHILWGMASPVMGELDW